MCTLASAPDRRWHGLARQGIWQSKKLQISRDQIWGRKMKQKESTPKGNKQFPH